MLSTALPTDEPDPVLRVLRVHQAMVHRAILGEIDALADARRPVT
jgi:hypothetical protein